MYVFMIEIRQIISMANNLNMEGREGVTEGTREGNRERDRRQRTGGILVFI